jgi:AraC-like DNA-binding protein
MKLVYSTPGEYIQAINKEANSYPSKTDDFFPYGDDVHDYWTGYFTSRTGVKGFVREFGRWIQAVRKHLAELKINNRSKYITENAKTVEENIWKI